MITPMTPDVRNGHQSSVGELLQNNLSLKALQEMVEALRQDRELLTRFMAERETELAQQYQVVAELEEKLKTVSEVKHQALEIELSHEKQRQETLETMLIRHQENLERLGTQFREYEKIVQQRQTQKPTQTKTPLSVNQGDILHSAPPNQTYPSRQTLITWFLTLSATGLLITSGSFLLSNRQPSNNSPLAVAEPSPIQAVAALGYIEPQGEIITVSAPVFSENSPQVQKLLVQEGDYVKTGDVIAILDIRDRLQAELEQAKQGVIIAQARLQQIQAGAKNGDIVAQMARYQQAKAELEGQIAAQKATILNLKAQYQGEKQAQNATLESVKAELSNAKADCNRYRLLHEEGVVALQERDRLCLKAATTQERVKEAQANLQRITKTLQNRINEAQANLSRTVATLEGQITEDKAMLDAVIEIRPVDIQVAQAEVEAAKARMNKVQTDLGMTAVRAPQDGQVLEILTRAGEMIGSKGIVKLGQTKQMYVRAEVYETDISHVRIGQPVTINSEGVIQNVRGTVEEIGLQINKQKILGTDPGADLDARVIKVKIRLDPNDSQRVKTLTNLQVNVVIDTSSASQQ